MQIDSVFHIVLYPFRKECKAVGPSALDTGILYRFWSRDAITKSKDLHSPPSKRTEPQPVTAAAPLGKP